MPAPNRSQDVSEVNVSSEHGRCEDVALRLYAERSVGLGSRNVASTVLILQCFKDAQTFLDIAQQLREGKLSVDKPETRLADASAPNLPATHPMNLISQRFVEKNGGTEDAVVKRIEHIVAFLKANPTLGRPVEGEDNPGPDKVILDEVEVKGGEPIRLNWTTPEVNTARLILPPVIKEPVKAG